MEYDLQRWLHTTGVKHVIVASSQYSRTPGDRVTADSRDAVAVTESRAIPSMAVVRYTPSRWTAPKLDYGTTRREFKGDGDRSVSLEDRTLDGRPKVDHNASSSQSHKRDSQHRSRTASWKSCGGCFERSRCGVHCAVSVRRTLAIYGLHQVCPDAPHTLSILR